MTAGLPAWDDDAGLIARIEADFDALPTRKGDQHERRVARRMEKAAKIEDNELQREFDALEAAMRAEEAARLTLPADERAALLNAFESSDDDRLDALCAVLRVGAPSPGFLAVLAEMIALRLLHGPARTPFGAREPLPSAIELRFLHHDYAAGLALLFGGAYRADKYHGRALELVQAKYFALGWSRSAINLRMKNARAKLPDERRAGYALWRRVKQSTAELK